jgi:hypothetical protein
MARPCLCLIPWHPDLPEKQIYSKSESMIDLAVTLNLKMKEKIIINFEDHPREVSMDLGTVSTLWYFWVFYFIVIISPAISEKKD